MSRHKRKHCCWVAGLLATILITGLWWSQGYSQKSRSREAHALLPAETILYYSQEAARKHQSAREKAASYQAFSKTELQHLFGRLSLTVLSNRIGARLQESGKEDDVMRTLSQCWNNGFSLSVSPPKGGPPSKVWAVLVLHDAAALEQQVTEAIKVLIGSRTNLVTRTFAGRRLYGTQLENWPGIEVGWWAEGDHLVVTAGPNPLAITSALKVALGDAPNLSGSDLIKSYQSSDKFEQDRLAWINVAQIRRAYGALRVPFAATRKPATYTHLFRILGMGNLESVVYRAGFKDQATWSETMFKHRGPREGLLTLCDQRPLTLKDLPPLPLETDGFYAKSVEFGSAFDKLNDIANQVIELAWPDESTQRKDSLKRTLNGYGFELDREFFDCLGGMFCIYSDQSQSLMLPSGALVIDVKDEATLKKTLEKAIEAVRQRSEGQLQVQRRKTDGRETVILQRAGIPLSLCIAVDQKWLVASFSPQDIDSFFARLSGKLKRWEPSREQQAALDELPKQFTSIGFADPRVRVRQLFASAPIMLNLLQTQMQRSGLLRPEQFLPITVVNLPRTDRVIDPLFSNFTVTRVDNDGSYRTSRSSTPSLPFTGGTAGGVGAATVGIITALMLPEVEHALQATRQAESVQNLKQIGQALHDYHNVWGFFPEATIKNPKLKSRQRLSWQVELLPFIGQTALYNTINRDLPWDSPANRRASSTTVPTYQNPHLDGKRGETHYVGMGGFGDDAPTQPISDPRAGFFGYDRVTRISEIGDGAANTIAVMEASKKLGSWTSGGPATVRPLTQEPYIDGENGFGGVFPEGANALFADGSVRFLSKDIDPRVMEALSTINGGEDAKLP